MTIGAFYEPKDQAQSRCADCDMGIGMEGTCTDDSGRVFHAGCYYKRERDAARRELAQAREEIDGLKETMKGQATTWESAAAEMLGKLELAEAGGAALRTALEAAQESIEQFRLADIGFPVAWGGAGTRDELVKAALSSDAGRAILALMAQKDAELVAMRERVATQEAQLTAADEVVDKARWILDDSQMSEDGQAQYLDPGLARDVEAALNAYDATYPAPAVSPADVQKPTNDDGKEQG